MDAFIINGGKRLSGNVKIGGAKNSALKLMCAALLTDKPVILHNVPELDDITSMARLLAHLGAKLGSHENNTLEIQADNVNDLTAPYELVRRMRASIIVLGPLLARFGKVKVSLPGGCAIGTRPVDMHLKALEQMGATIEIDGGYVIAEAKQLVGAEIFFEKVSVGATENILMAATLAEGETVLHNAAREPEIVDLANMLIKMGAKIEGAGNETIKITGVPSLGGVEHTTVADRIEAGSFIIAAAITNGDVFLENVPANIMGASLPKMREAGIIITEEGNGLRAKGSGSIKATNVITAPYPGFATDMQAQFMTLMCLADGTSTIEETIFENRFMHVPELARMGADIKITGHSAVVTGVDKFKGAEVMATDLRASFSLVIAALAAEGQTKINRVYHIDRGYEKVVRRLAALGADIVRVKETI
jgi:UDP-N-acetylglucosamine 1-carboxyvinyltransferase